MATTPQISPATALATKPARLHARLTGAQKTLLEHAARLSGRSLTEFVVSSAEDAAARTIREQQILTLSSKDTEVFLSALLGPAPPTPRLVRAAKRHRERSASVP